MEHVQNFAIESWWRRFTLFDKNNILRLLQHLSGGLDLLDAKGRSVVGLKLVSTLSGHQGHDQASVMGPWASYRETHTHTHAPIVMA